MAVRDAHLYTSKPSAFGQIVSSHNFQWVGDTTELVVGSNGKLYLAAIVDLSSRFIVGWAVSAVNDRHSIKALEMALKRRCPEVGLLHHSDQGCTYASEDYQALILTEYSVRVVAVAVAGQRL